jgi:hypothetical protein
MLSPLPLSILLTREAVKVDSTQQLKEAHSVLGELGEVLIDHVQSGLKNSIEYRGNLWSKEGLQKKN